MAIFETTPLFHQGSGCLIRFTRNTWLPALLACMLLLGGCEGSTSPRVTPIKARSLDDLRAQLTARAPDMELFRLLGPFQATIKKEFSIGLAPGESLRADLYLAAHPGKAPLVILLHGHGNSKEDHGGQGLHLATWGMHSLVLSLPPAGPWIRHGNTLARLTRLIRERPAILDARVDPARILLAGHSFGASAVAVALADETPAVGGLLLDPAGVGRAIPGYLKRVRVPVMSIGSDERVTLTRNRGYFFQYVPGNMASVSIANASHEDAQLPLERTLAPQEDADNFPDEEHQITYVSALVASAFSLGMTGNLDYAWACYEAAKERRMFGGMKK